MGLLDRWSARGLFLSCGGALVLSACTTTYPYSADYTACDVRAGDCYQFCEQYAEIEEDYLACHADCEAEANQCFASAYDRYRYSPAYTRYSYYGPRTWYGRYGSWYPSTGYVFGFHYFGGNYGYTRRGYRHRYDYPRGDRHRYRRDRRDRRRDDSGAAPASPPAQPAVPNSSPPAAAPRSSPPPRRPGRSRPQRNNTRDKGPERDRREP